MTTQSVAPVGGALLLDPILRLVTKLREAGVPVSSSEVIDATSALNAIDVLDREQVRVAMAATLVKRAEDRAAFEVMFELLFAVRRGARPGDAPVSREERRQITTSLDRVALDGDDPGGGGAELLELIMEAIRRGDPEALRALAEMAVERYGGMGSQRDASERYFLYRVLRALELSRLMGDMLRTEVAESGREESVVRAELAERIEAFKKLIASEVRNQLAEARGPDETTRAMELLGREEVDFLGASPGSWPRCARRSARSPGRSRRRWPAVVVAGIAAASTSDERSGGPCRPVASSSTRRSAGRRSRGPICICCATSRAPSPSSPRSRCRCSRR